MLSLFKKLVITCFDCIIVNRTRNQNKRVDYRSLVQKRGLDAVTIAGSVRDFYVRQPDCGIRHNYLSPPNSYA